MKSCSALAPIIIHYELSNSWFESDVAVGRLARQPQTPERPIPWCHMVLASLLCMLLVCVAKAATVVGFTPGSFSVGPSGAATYSIPLSVPHGIADLQPTLSVDYSSHARRGLLGLGWTISGMSTITRCPRTKRQDGINGSITFSSSDRLCLNGQRLVMDGSAVAYGSVGAVYRTEGEAFSRVKALVSPNTGQVYFKMETKSGLVYEFGNTSGSAIKPGPSPGGSTQPTVPLLWAVNQVSDRFGNAIQYTYVSDSASGSYAPDKITYNGGKAYVQFNSTTTPDAKALMLSGTRVGDIYLVNSVEAHIKDEGGVDQLVKSYGFTYDTTGLYGIPDKQRLVKVTKCGSSGQTCFNPITFEWSYTDDSLRRYSLHSTLGPIGGPESFHSANGFPDEGTTPRFVADVNGDGLADLVAFKTDGVHVLLNSDVTGWAQTSRPVLAAFGTSQGWSNQFERPRRLADVDGDGYPDIVGFAASSVMVSKWNPSTQTFGVPYTANSTLSTVNDDQTRRYLADMDGDGYLDIVANDSGTGVSVCYGDGTNFGAPTSVSSDFTLAKGWGAQSINPRELVDMNGDGYPDLVGFGSDGVYVALWDPVQKKFGVATLSLPAFGTAAPANTPVGAWNDDTKYPRRLIDVNGDGYPDIVGFASSGIYVSLWDGTKFLPPSPWTTLLTGSPWGNEQVNPRNLMDLNNDGLPDIVAFGTDGIHVLLNTGFSFVASSAGVTKWASVLGSAGVDEFGEQYNNEGLYPRKLADLDGDGLPDIVAFGKSGVYGSSPFFAQIYSQFRIAGRAGTRITGIVDSLGGRTDIQYSLAAGAGSYYKRSASTLPTRDVIGPLVLVTQVSRSSGLASGAVKQRYRYGGLKAHRDYGSLGFETMAVRDEQTGIETLTAFSQIYPFTGQAAMVETARSTVTNEVVLGASCSQVGALCQKTFTVTRNSTPITRTTNTLASYPMGEAGEYSGNSRIFTYVSGSLDVAWELDGTPLPSKTAAIEYNEPALTGGKQWGNVTKMTVAHSDGHQTITTNTYDIANETTWLLGRLSGATVRDIRPARAISVTAPTDSAPPPANALISPQALVPILTLLLSD